MEKYILETCIDSVESALAAASAGAKRLEMCGNLIIGGTTPSQELYKQIRKYSDIKIMALIRPRFGDFCYTEYEFEIMKGEVEAFRELGADGIAIGILKPDGTINTEQMKQIIEISGDMKITLHRAFDMCENPIASMEEAVKIGISTILTSGQKNHCLRGKDLIKELVEKAKGRIDILVAGGVDASVIEEMQPYTGATSFHMSGKIVKESRMQYRKEDVNMGLPSLSEYEIWQTDIGKIQKAVEVCKRLIG